MFNSTIRLAGKLTPSAITNHHSSLIFMLRVAVEIGRHLGSLTHYKSYFRPNRHVYGLENWLKLRKFLDDVINPGTRVILELDTRVRNRVPGKITN